MANSGFDLTALLNKYSHEQIIDLYQLLKQDRKNATYKLLQSLDWQLSLDVAKLKYEINFTGIEYLKFVRDGRRPGAKPPPTSAIEDYLRAKSIPIKFAVPVKKKIAEKGIKPYDFVQMQFTDDNIEKLGEQISAVLQNEISQRIKTITQ